jgi:hypothetical protein
MVMGSTACKSRQVGRQDGVRVVRRRLRTAVKAALAQVIATSTIGARVLDIASGSQREVLARPAADGATFARILQVSDQHVSLPPWHTACSNHPA